MNRTALSLTASLLVLLFSASTPIVSAQAPGAERERAIAGRVLADDGQPLAGALVMAVAGGKPLAVAIQPQTATCDGEGNFKITGLARGVYTLMARAPGYVTEAGQPRRYRPGEQATIHLVRGGVITGRVTDEFGEPLTGVQVTADRVRDAEGKPDLFGPAFGVEALWATDDRGIYRIYGLPPGTYIVGCNSPSLLGGVQLPIRRAPATYHPSSPRGAAAELAVQSGAELSGIDIRYRAARGRSISGALTSEAPAEGLVNPVLVALTEVGGKRLAGMAVSFTGRNYSLPGVEDGEYELSAARYNENLDFALSVPRRVTMRGADLEGIDLKLFPLGSISGRIISEPAKAGAACQPGNQFSLEETLIRARGSDKPGAIFGLLDSQVPGGLNFDAAPDEGGGFTLKNLTTGRYRIEADLPGEDWYLRALTQKTPGAAKLAKPIDLSLNGLAVKAGEKLAGVEALIAEGAATLAGRIVPVDEKTSLPKRLRIHLLPAESVAANEVLRYYEKSPGEDGSFEFKHVAPGQYLLHLRPAQDAGEEPMRPAAWDAVERARLRREAEAAKQMIELKSCQRVRGHVLRWPAK